MAPNDSLLALLDLSSADAAGLPPPLRRKVVAFLLSWGAWADAKPLIEAEAAAAPRSLRQRSVLAKAYSRTGDIAAAEEISRELAGEFGGQPMTLAAQGDLLVAKGEYAAAVETYRRMLACNPNDADAWSHIARACQAAGRWDAAEEYCRRALAEHLRRRSRSGATPSCDADHSRVPTHLLRLLHRQASGAGRAAEAEAIGRELDQRRREAASRIRKLLAAYFRSIGSAPPVGSSESKPPPIAQPPDTLIPRLKDLFGFPSFRPGQRQAVEAALGGESVLVVMPTGGGKSLCFQLPAALADGLTLVISPLIALMKDQVEGLPPQIQRLTTVVNSSLEGDEIQRRLDGIRDGRFKLVYAAPERLRQRPFIHALRSRPVSLFVIDEAHCLSLWGHDFRPDYLFLRTALKEISAPTVMAMTATATPAIQEEISSHLERPLRLISTGTFRPNLHLECVRLATDDEKMQFLVRFCRETAGSGIVYVGARVKTERLAALLRRRGVKASCYHAGMQTEDRTAAQECFMSGECRVMAATTAFGMGVDKADIRFVVNYSPPHSLEDYYQQVGRAGRDGLPSRCVMMYTPGDKANLTRWLRQGQIRIEHLRDCYRLIRDTVGLGGRGPVVIGDLERDTGLDETKVRVAISLLEKSGLVRRHFDLPQSLTIEARRDARGDEEFAAFVSAARLRPGQRLAMETTHLSERSGIPLDEIEQKLLGWQDSGWIRLGSSGRAMLLETPRPRGDERQALERMLKLYDEAQRARVDMMFDYATSKKCRHGLIATHFGEAAVENCGACDNCRPPAPIPVAAPAPRPERVVPEHEAPLLILRAVSALPFPLGKRGIVKALKGSPDSPVLQNRFRLFGALSNYPKSRIERAVDDLVARKLLAVGGDEYFLLSLTDEGKKALEYARRSSRAQSR